MFPFSNKPKQVEQKRTRYIVFIALQNNEGIAEDCESKEAMMKQYFKYSEKVKSEQWIHINDATLKVEEIRYIRYIEQ